jgi:signal peptidase I
LLVAEPDRQPATGAGSDLRAQIKARVEQRRQAGRLPRGHPQMSRSRTAESVDGQPDAAAEGTSRLLARPRGGRHAQANGRSLDERAVPDGDAPEDAAGTAERLDAVNGANAAMNGTGVAERTRETDGLALPAAPGGGEPAAPGGGEPALPAAPGGGEPAAPSGGEPTVELKRPPAVESTLLPAAEAAPARQFRTRPEQPAGAGRRRHAATASGPSLLDRAVRWILLLAVTAAAVFGLRQYVIASYYIPSASMETTLHGCPGCQPDMVLVDKLSYRFKSIDRSDVVVFARPPQAPPEDKQLIKRVIGLPGEVVNGHDGHVFVNNKELVEPYVNPACHGTADFAAVRVPANRYFVMGDNRCDSFDSRMFGTIPRSAVIGKAFAVIWPVHHLRWL